MRLSRPGLARVAAKSANWTGADGEKTGTTFAQSAILSRTPPFHRYHGSKPDPSFQFVAGMSFDHP
jgi:hypothetical protein